MPTDPIPRAAAQLVRRLNELGRVSDERDALTRTFLSPAMKRANALVGGWMKSAGLTVHVDSVGNLVGRAKAVDSPVSRKAGGPKTLLLGSHLDTVRHAGKFDGPLGVLLPIAALEVLRARKVSLPFAVEVLGFSEEEGVRFASAYLGSKGFTGQLRTADLKLRDADGISIGDALDSFTRGRFSPPPPAHRGSNLLGYVETHIEQGPVLEAADLAVGVVSSIAGQTRVRITLTGKAGHAGTTPMKLRRDALAGAAEFTLSAEQLARSTPGLVATVGTLSVQPGAANVIPGEATFTLDLRHAVDATRRAALRAIRAAAAEIATRRRLGLHWQVTQDNPATPCSALLTAALARSVKQVQKRSLALVSGAGHDGVVVSKLTPIAMLFVRCRDGLSHHPDEHASPKDITVALRVIVDFLACLAETETIRA